MDRTALLVTTDYPPLVGTNTRRVEGLARHLSEYGWRPVVLTLAIEDMRTIESSWPGDGPVETVRVSSPGVQAFARRLRGQRPRTTGELAAMGSAGLAVARTHVGRSIWKRLLGPVWAGVVQAERLCYVPDPHRLWAAAAVRAGLRYAAKRSIAAVVTSSPPFSAHFVGLALQRRLGVPWIADFADLWVGRPFRTLPYAWQHWPDRRYEARVVARADRLLMASPGWLPIFERRYGAWATEKATVITNGFDSTLTAALDDAASVPAEAARPLTLVYTGALHEGLSPQPIAAALLRLAERIGRERVRAGLSVRLIGPGAADWGDLRNQLDVAGLGGVIQFLGTRSHAECLREQRAADALLILLAPSHDMTISGKSFEYMATGKPILALVPDGSVQGQILAPSGLATVVSYDDVAATERVLEAWLADGVPGVEADRSYINGFECRQLAGTLAKVLDGCVGAVHPQPAERMASS